MYKADSFLVVTKQNKKIKKFKSTVTNIYSSFCSDSPVFKELLSRIMHEKKNGGPHIPKIQEKKGNRFSIADFSGDIEFPTDSKSTRKMKANTVSGGRNKIRRMLEKTRFSILPPKPFR